MAEAEGEHLSEMLFFDTNVARSLRDRPPAELKKFWAWIHDNYRYAIAPLVVAEVLKSLKESPEEHLRDARRELSALRGPQKPIMLPLLGPFIGRTLFGTEREHPHVSAKTMALVFEAGRRVKRVVRMTVQDVRRVVLAESVEYPAIILDFIVDPIIEGQESLIAALERTKERKAAPLEAIEWAHEILEALALPSTPAASTILANACRAAYHYQRFLWTEAAKDYNPRKHSGDWIDQQILMYLAYQRAVFVTAEKKLPARIAGSGQENRVWAFEDIWAASQT